MSIDWAATGSMLTGIGTIASALAIGAAAWIGRSTASNFRDQKKAERELEYAERTLALAYKLESALNTVRSPMSYQNEHEASEAELQQTDWFDQKTATEKTRRVQANIFYQRFKRFEKEFDEALTLLPFVKAYFGEEAGQALEKIIRARHSVRVYADAYAEDDGSDIEHTITIRKYIWHGFSEKHEDPVGESVTSGIQTLERILSPIIRSTIQNNEPAKLGVNDD